MEETCRVRKEGSKAPPYFGKILHNFNLIMKPTQSWKSKQIAKVMFLMVAILLSGYVILPWDTGKIALQTQIILGIGIALVLAFLFLRVLLRSR